MPRKPRLHCRKSYHTFFRSRTNEINKKVNKLQVVENYSKRDQDLFGCFSYVSFILLIKFKNKDFFITLKLD